MGRDNTVNTSSEALWRHECDILQPMCATDGDATSE